MHNSVKILCTLDTTDPACALGMEIWLDDLQIFDCAHVTEPIKFEHEFSDQDAQHLLRFVMKGKQLTHTQVDADGQIVSDARLLIKNLSFDEIELGQILIDHAAYYHNFNGSGPHTREKFYGELGCNGSVELEFSTPMYLWLLENM